MNGDYKIGDIVLGNWELVKLLGKGAFGKVFEAHREDFGTVYKAAIKIMTIPENQSEIDNARAEGMDDESITTYFRSFVGDMVQEFALMSKLKGTANIVSYEDHSVTPHSQGIGWDILIRMELLTPMLNYMGSHPMLRSDVIKLGIDMCKALELCQRYNIIHRDIKPENIFISDSGDYKLGDFGVARTLEKTQGGLSKKGTYTYMAPEIYRDEKYGSTVDIYSLGIVLYRLLNNNRAPFLPAPPQVITHSERERALVRRISGEPLPPPANAGVRLAEIVLKACAYEPKDRYTSPLQMRQELEAIQYNKVDDLAIYGKSDQIRVDTGAYTKNRGDDQYDATVYLQREEKPKTIQPSVTMPDADDVTEKIVFEKSPKASAVDAVKEDPASKPEAPASPKAASTLGAIPAQILPRKKRIGLIAGVAGAMVLLIALLAILLPKKKGKASVSALEANREVATAPEKATEQPTVAVLETIEQIARAEAMSTASPESTASITPELTAESSETGIPAVASVDKGNESITKYDINDLFGSWDTGSLRISRLGYNRLGVDITDNRVPEGYVMSEEAGEENAPCWRFTITLVSGETWAVETFLGIDLSTGENTTRDFCRSEGASPYGFVQTGSTSSFDVIFDCPPYTIENIRKITVQMKRESRHGVLNFTDSHEFVIDSARHEHDNIPQDSDTQEKRTYIVTFDANGGFFDDAHTVSRYTVGIPSGMSIPKGDAPYAETADRTMMAEDWSLKPEGGDSVFAQGVYVPETDVTLYAVYGTAYHVYIEPNGGYFLESPNSINYMIYVGEKHYNTFDGAYWTQKMGHKTPNMVIEGWYLDSMCTEFACTANENYIPTESPITLYPKWVSQMETAEVSQETWRELPIQVQGDDYQIMSVRYLGGPEIEKIELYTWGGINGGSEFDTYFINNTNIVDIIGTCDAGLPYSDEDIEMWRPFAKKYLKERFVPTTPQNPIAINYGRLTTEDTLRTWKDYLLWFGADTNGELVSVIIVELGFPTN